MNLQLYVCKSRAILTFSASPIEYLYRYKAKARSRIAVPPNPFKMGKKSSQDQATPQKTAKDSNQGASGKENGTHSTRDHASASEASKDSNQCAPESLAKATLSPKSNREVQEKSSKEKHVTICLDPVIGRSARVEPCPRKSDSRDPVDENRKQKSEM